MDYVICIPTYKRYTHLRDQTLTMLKNEGYDPKDIFVYVANEEEKKLYEATLVPGTYGSLTVGVIGLPQQRNFIYDQFPIGQKILMLDDDIKEVMFKNEKRPVKEVVARMWELAAQEGATLWSIYPCPNRFYCVERVVVGQVFCVGCFHGVINTRTYYPDLAAAEDRWLTASRILKDGKTLRYEGCCPKTVYFQKGGLYDYRHTNTKQYDDSVKVAEMFPTICKLKQYKKNGFWDAVIPLKWVKKYQLFDSAPTRDESKVAGDERGGCNCGSVSETPA